VRRRSFTFGPDGQVIFGDDIGTQPFEAGWKDTITCEAHSVRRACLHVPSTADAPQATTVVVRFHARPGRYVYHCHMLEHEVRGAPPQRSGP
jgi:FtsP/CotA-like multicopper oxidase with cupredoxin domain